MSSEPSVLHSVERISSILLELARSELALGVSELSRTLQMPKSAVHRTLTSLASTGLVVRESTSQKYRLGPRAIELGLAAMGGTDIRGVALPMLQRLADKTTETATLSLLVGRERVYIAQVEGPQTVRMTVPVGKRFPLYAGASGRAILAHFEAKQLEKYLQAVSLEPLTKSTIISRDRLATVLSEVRSRGYAVSAGERDPWAAAVAAPLRNLRGWLVGSVSVCGPIERFKGAVPEELGLAAVDGAADLSSRLP